MPSLNHIHTYIRKSGNERKPYESIFKCADPYCTHIADAKSIKDKASICSKCKTAEIVMNVTQLKLARPRCEECSNKPENKQKQQLKKTLEALDIFKEEEPKEEQIAKSE
jgi:hypothetical protein